MYLPDSNIFILAFSGSAKEKELLTKIVGKGQLYLSVITTAEVLAKANAQEEQTFRDLMSEFPVLSIDIEVSEVASDYRKSLSGKSKRIVLLDCFLAAQAKIHHLTLVTNNRADFPMKDIRIIAP